MRLILTNYKIINLKYHKTFYEIKTISSKKL
nr:MAG TPA: hypothetical protein [Caudoviricetes sp.]